MATELAGRLVPVGALHEERQRRKQVENQLRALMGGTEEFVNVVPASDLREELRKRIDAENKVRLLKKRVAFLEEIIAEYAKYARHSRRDEWAQLTPRLRFAVLLRDNFQCTYCGATAKGGATLTIDHIVPRSAGGRNTVSNLRTACLPCNQGKSNTLLELEGMARPSRSASAVTGGQPPEAEDSGGGATPQTRPRDAEPVIRQSEDN